MGAFFIVAAGKTREAFLVEDLPNGSDTQRGTGVFEGTLNIVDGEILFPQGEDEFPNGAFLGLGARAGFDLAEEVWLKAAEVVAQDAK